MPEQWKKIVGYGGDYEVSDLGRVRSYKWGKLRVLKPGVSTKGYLRVGLFSNGKRKNHRVHRLVAKAFTGPAPDGHEVNHKDADKAHNMSSNLEWVTRSGNRVHAERLGLTNHARGERNGRSKLAVNQVIEIRRIYAEGNITQREVGAIFGIAQSTARDVITRKSWKHLK